MQQAQADCAEPHGSQNPCGLIRHTAMSLCRNHGKDGVRMNLENISIQECIEKHEKEQVEIVITAGQITGFITKEE